jgi:hypothetical protein
MKYSSLRIFILYKIKMTDTELMELYKKAVHNPEEYKEQLKKEYDNLCIEASTLRDCKLIPLSDNFWESIRLHNIIEMEKEIKMDQQEFPPLPGTPQEYDCCTDYS